MLKPISVLIAGLALALAAPGALAQVKGSTKKKASPPPPAAPAPAPASSGGVGEGNTEFNFFGALQDHDALGTSIILGVGFGRFVSDNLELKLTQQLFYLDSDFVSIFQYSPYVSAEFQIRPNPSAPLVAYVGGGVGMSLGSQDILGSTYFTYGLFVTPVGGVKYFLNERTSLTYSLSYQFPLVEEICGDTTCVDSETTTLTNTLGFSIYY